MGFIKSPVPICRSLHFVNFQAKCSLSNSTVKAFHILNNRINRRYNHLGYSLRRYFVDEFHFHHVPNLPVTSRVLDLGGNKFRKRGQFDIAQYNLRVVYANLSTAKQPDVLTDAAWVPFQDGCFDTVIYSELLEHVRNPEAVLRETFRVLSEGGTVLITVPFLYRIHADPHDFGRYTDHYWHSVLQEVGFHDIVIEQQGLFYSVLVDFLKQYANHIHIPRPFGRVSRWLIAKLTISPMQHWALRHEQNPRVQASPFLRSFTTGFGIVATKK